MSQRKKTLDDMHSQLKKYINRMPAALVKSLIANYSSTFANSFLALYNSRPSSCPALSRQSSSVRYFNTNCGESSHCFPPTGTVDYSSCREIIIERPCFSRNILSAKDLSTLYVYTSCNIWLTETGSY